MILIENFPEVMAQLEKERGIDKKTLIEALSMAMIAATKKKFGNVDNLEVSINTESGETRIFANRTVSAEVTDPFLQISLAEAKKINDMLEVDDVIAVEVTPKQEELGRLAAQTAKQVISQKIREAEKDLIQKEFSGKMGSIVSGTVQRIEGRNILVNLGRVEALLYPREQIHREHFDPKKHSFTVYIKYHTPKYFNKQGTISHSSMDVGNINKVLLDVLFTNAFHGNGHMQCENINHDDCFISALMVAKVPSDDYHFDITVKIIPLPTT